MSYERLCSGCFVDKGEARVCSRCGYDEGEKRSPLVLPHRSLLHQSQYLVGRVLGKPGGFGITYLGYDTRLETRVAIKEYLPRDLAGRESNQQTVSAHSSEDDELFRFGLEQFLGEARLLAKFDHANIVRVRNFFEEHGTGYLVMDYYEGVSLSEYLEHQPGGRIGEKVAASLMMPILDGLREVHGKGILHRDIKPANIYLTTGNRPILLDFGAARQAMGERSKSLSAVLSDGYAPTEQYHRKGNQGPWTDIYGSSAVLYRCVTGKNPPPAIERMAKDDLEPAERFGVTADFAAILHKGLAVDCQDRIQSVSVLQQLLSGETIIPDSAPDLQHVSLLQETDRKRSAFGRYFIDVLKKYAVFKGRASRKEYWMFSMFNFFGFILLQAFQFAARKSDAGSENLLYLLICLGLVYQLVLFLPMTAVGWRRMHDTNHRGWWLLFPIVNLVFALQKGSPDSNRFGPSPDDGSQKGTASTKRRNTLNSDGRSISEERLKEPHLERKSNRAWLVLVAVGILIGVGWFGWRWHVEEMDQLAMEQVAKQQELEANNARQREALEKQIAEQKAAEAEAERLRQEQEQQAEAARLQQEQAQKEETEKNEAATDEFKVGDSVKVRSTVTGPCYGWGDVKAGDVGVITEIGEKDLKVNFERHVGWNGCKNEMELVSGTGNTETSTEQEMDFYEAVAAYEAEEYTKAASGFRYLAERGDVNAQFNLGICYDNGNGVPEDDQEAVKWYRKAAEQGKDKAQFNLAVCYEFGMGVPKDDQEALEWYRKAAENGYEKAKEALSRRSGQ